MESFVNINPWTQFYDLEDRKDIPLSYADHITVEDCRCECREYFNVKPEPTQYQLPLDTAPDINYIPPVPHTIEEA